MPNSKYQIYKDKAGKFRFRLLAANAQPILKSQAYKSKVACKNGINAVKRNATSKSKFTISQSKSKKYYFNIISGNKEVVGTSQLYASRDTLRKGVASVMRNAKSKVEEV
ncbi:MAG: YegP family protein [Ignavibacteria bacterium]|nr:YegP family protein [Ignavibacteria bacterium]MBT8382215.1 YegP family protein [Ignavibacteria bacterium]MBT8390924.1 YegP family protein [Ignavibacteria bacterium]NNJ52371.1 YegP family protein [Ignavibacteriaceae bacterium]NNL20590.1 YegP family protein [Ignavibacteriaceae bacterium]